MKSCATYLERTKLVFAVAVWVTVTTLFTASVHARSIPGIMGKSRGVTEWSTKGLGTTLLGRKAGPGGSLTNSAVFPTEVLIPLPIDASGAKTVQVEAFGNDTSQRVICTAWASTRDWYTVSSSARGYISEFGRFATISLSANLLWPDGLLYAHCILDPGAKIVSVYYNQ